MLQGTQHKHTQLWMNVYGTLYVPMSGAKIDGINADEDHHFVLYNRFTLNTVVSNIVYKKKKGILCLSILFDC